MATPILGDRTTNITKDISYSLPGPCLLSSSIILQGSSDEITWTTIANSDTMIGVFTTVAFVRCVNGNATVIARTFSATLFGSSHFDFLISHTLNVSNADSYYGIGANIAIRPTLDIPLGSVYGGQIAARISESNTYDYGFIHGLTASAQPNGLAGATYSFVLGIGGYINSGFSGANVIDLYAVYANYDRFNDTGIWSNAYSFYANDLSITAALNAYYLWLDSNGVFRIREDATFNGVAQAIAALYNPQFTKYTPGATNFERVVLGQFNNNIAEYGTQAGGTGTLRAVKLIGDHVKFGTYYELTEMSAPASGAANTCRVYVEDNGAGKTRLMAKFNTGAAQQLAIEP